MCIRDSLSIPGLVPLTTEYKTGYGFNIDAGYNFDGFRLEGEFGYKAADVDKFTALGASASISGVDMTVLSYMVNGYYDVKVNAPVQPFFGVGIGVINGELDIVGNKFDDTVFGYQFTAGVTGAVNKNLNLDLYYRFQGAASDFEKEGGKLAYTSSNIFAGVRFNF